MSRGKSNRSYLIASAALGALVFGMPARAADLKLPAEMVAVLDQIAAGTVPA